MTDEALSTISGTVSSSDSGVPLEIWSGSGVNNTAKVYLFDENGGNDSPAYWANVQTDGSYVINDVAAGTYLFLASSPNFSVQTMSRTIYSGEDLNLDFNLVPFSGSVTGSVYTITSVSNPLFKVYQATVEIESENLSTSTGLSGTYTFSGLKDGMYEIKVSKRGYVPSLAWVKIVKGVTVAKDILIYDKMTISGTVSDESGNKLEKVNMVLSSPQSKVPSKLPSKVNNTVTEGDGSYAFKNVPPGSYNLEASFDGFVFQSQIVTVVSSSITDLDFALVESESDTTSQGVGSITAILNSFDTDVYLNPLGTISLQDDIGNTVSSFKPWRYSEPSYKSYFGGMINVSANFSDITPGEYSMTTDLVGFSVDTQTVVVTQNYDSSVEVELNPVTGGFFVSISDDENDLTNKATIEVIDSNGDSAGELNLDYGVTLYTLLKPGTYSLKVSVDGYESQTKTGLEVIAGGFTLQEFTLTYATGIVTSTVTGTVSSSDSEVPLEIWSGSGVNNAAKVYLFDQNGDSDSLDYWANVQMDGSYVIKDVAAGNYLLLASSPNFSVETMLITIVPGGDLIQSFVLDPFSGSVTGSVVKSGTDFLMSGVTVEIESLGLSFLTYPPGTYTFSNLIAGTYEIKVSKAGYASNTESVTINKGFTTNQDISISSLYDSDSGDDSNAGDNS